MSGTSTARATFLSQPCRHYRNFQLVFSVLTLMFAVSSVAYTFLPGQVLDGFLWINTFLGGDVAFDFPDRESHFWRLLGAGNVVTLAVCCGMLQRNIQKNYAVLYPLAAMKGFVAISWTIVWILWVREPLFFVAAALDMATLFVILWFAPKARRAVDNHPDLPRVPSLTP